MSQSKRKLLQSVVALAIVSGFAAVPAFAQDKPIKIGVTGGPHAQIFEQVKKVAEKDGLKIQVIEFSDYVQPNAALAAMMPAGATMTISICTNCVRPARRQSPKRVGGGWPRCSTSMPSSRSQRWN